MENLQNFFGEIKQCMTKILSTFIEKHSELLLHKYTEKISAIATRISNVALDKIVPCHPYKFHFYLQESTRDFCTNSRSFS